MKGVRVLFVDDDVLFAQPVRRQLEKRGASVTWRGTLSEAWTTLHVETFDVLLLDKRLPDGDGLQLLEAHGAFLPAVRIVLSGYLDVPASVTGQLEGAVVLDKALMESPDELVEVILRIDRGGCRLGTELEPLLNIEGDEQEPGLRLIADSGILQYGGRWVQLTKKEEGVFRLLLSRQRSLVPAGQIASTILQRTDLGAEDAAARIISRLRAKLREVGAERLLKTRAGRGWWLDSNG